MKRLVWLKKRRLLIGMIAVLSTVGMLALIRNVTWFDWTGFGEDVIVSASQERDQKGNLTKTITTTTPQSAKTLWDWLSVLGVPFSLAILGFWLQQLQQKRVDEQTRLERERTEQQEKFEKERAEQQAKLEKEIAEANQREEALQAYFDRLSTLLVDRNLIAIATKIENSKNIAIDNQSKSSIAEQKELLDAAVGVVQARTLSILRRLQEDGERKTSVMRFLMEAKVISKLKLDFSGAYLNDTDLSGGDFHGINFSGANLNGANLFHANLSRASLRKADLSKANLRSADLTDSSFDGANLSGAHLSSAYLDGAKISAANFSDADLSRVQLRGTVKRDKNSHFAVHHSATVFREANFQRASFRDAKFFDAIFCNAIFKFADLSNANFSGADLTTAKNWTEDQLKSAKLCQTKLPDG